MLSLLTLQIEFCRGNCAHSSTENKFIEVIFVNWTSFWSEKSLKFLCFLKWKRNSLSFSALWIFEEFIKLPQFPNIPLYTQSKLIFSNYLEYSSEMLASIYVVIFRIIIYRNLNFLRFSLHPLAMMFYLIDDGKKWTNLSPKDQKLNFWKVFGVLSCNRRFTKVFSS